jgi:hypothetical protein
VPHQGAVPVMAADANSVEQVKAKHKTSAINFFLDQAERCSKLAMKRTNMICRMSSDKFKLLGFFQKEV